MEKKETSSMINRVEQQAQAPVQAPQKPYDQGFLLDCLLARLRLKEDAQLARKLRIDKRLIGRIRDHRLPISGSMLLLIQEATGISVSELRLMLQDRRRKSRMPGILNSSRVTK